MKEKKSLLIIVLGVVALIGVTFGLSYAFMSVGDQQRTANTFNTNGCLNIKIENESNSINLTNAYPMTDMVGLEQDGYTFTIKNTCNTKTNYMINLESLNQVSNTLDTQYIKASLSSDTMDNLIQKLESNLVTKNYIVGSYVSHNLYKGTIGGKDTKTFTLRLWMDYDTTKEQGASKTYTSKINVIAGTNIEATNTPEIKTTVNVFKLIGNITGEATSLNYCTSDSSVCEPNTSSTITNNKTEITLNRDNKQIICTKLNNNKTTCTDVIAAYIDTEIPIISNVATSVTKTEITVTVSASDDNEVTEYWYAIDDGAFVQETDDTPNTKTFGSLTAGSAHTIKVYVKDGTGKSSGVTTKGVTTSSPTSEDTLATLNITTYKTTEPTFSSAATTDEGVYRVSDGMYGGYSYYWRGAATTNHIIFANKCWRIVRINGDGTIRLIYNGTPSGTAPNQTCPGNGSNSASIAKASQAYNSSCDRAEYVGWTWATNTWRTTATTNKSNAMIQTDSWFDDNNNFTAAQRLQVVAGKFCNDRNLESGSWNSQPTSTFYYAARGRLESAKTPTLGCPDGDIYTVKAGAITADEVAFAGGVYGSSNDKYYLYNGQYYWTMSPYDLHLDMLDGRYACEFYVRNDGLLHGNVVSWTGPGLRPVINLKSDTTFNSGGLGTSSKPYVVA